MKVSLYCLNKCKHSCYLLNHCNKYVNRDTNDYMYAIVCLELSD